MARKRYQFYFYSEKNNEPELRKPFEEFCKKMRIK